jgi:hypothetical protein
MIVALGLELSAEADVAAIAVAGPEGRGHKADVVFYGSPDAVTGECARLYETTESCGLFLDPWPCAGILDGLRAAGIWLHEMTPEDVSAAAWQYTTELRGRRVKLGEHPALKAAMRSAIPRPLATRFAFERRRVPSDQSPLNACAFALWGIRRNEAAAQPGVWAF